MKLKRPIKKILTGIACLIVVAGIVSLCSVAYFRENTQPENKAFTFAPVRISQSTQFTSKAPANADAGTYDKNGYYITLDYIKQNSQIPYSIAVTNEGKKPIVVYVSITYPISVSTKSDSNAKSFTNVLSGFTPKEGSNWLLISTSKRASDCTANAVFAYNRLVEPGETLDGTEALMLNIKANAIQDESVLENMNIDVVDGYRQAQIQTTSIGIQDPVDCLTVKGEWDDTYDWSSSDPSIGPKTILTKTWETCFTDEMMAYYSENVRSINNNISDNAR